MSRHACNGKTASTLAPSLEIRKFVRNFTGVALQRVSERDDGAGKSTWSKEQQTREMERNESRQNEFAKKKRRNEERKREKEKRKERSTRQKKNCASLKKRPAVLVNHADAIPRYVSLENFLSPGAVLPSTAMFLFRVARKNEICSPLHCAT